MSDASLVSFLQSELLLLSNEIKKKYPEIKESIENIFQLIRKTKDDPDRPNAVEVFSQTELILQPIVLSSRTGNSRVLALAINCLQRLVVFKAFPRECIGSVFGVLEIAADMNSDIQLKTLQCLSPLMANYNDLYGAEIVKIFSIAFKLQESRTGMVNNATAAIIRQMMISLFEWVSEEQKLRNPSGDNSQDNSVFGEFSHAKDALLIFSDVTCRLDERKCEVLDLSKVDKPFALDLIESILVNHGNVIRNYRPFSQLLQERICPYLIQALKQNEASSANKTDFPKTCRHWRIIQLLVNEFNDLFPDEVEIFIAFGIRILRDNSSNWESAMVLEVSKGILQSPTLIEEVYLICEKKESLRLLKDLIEALIDIMKRVLDSHPSDSQGQITDALAKSSVLTQFDKSAPPAVSPIALLLLAYEAFNGWFSNMATLVKSSCLQDSSSSSSPFPTYKSSKSASMNPKTVAIVTDLVLFSGGSVVSIMERVFVELCSNQPQLHQSTLEFFSRAFLVFSIFEFRSQLRHLSAVLLILAAPISVKDFRKSHLLIIQMILETGYGVAQLLEDSLLLLVKVIQATENLQNLKSKKQQAHGILPQLIEEDVLAKALDLSVTLTESTAQWEEQSFTFLIQAYGQFIGEILSAAPGADIDERGLLLILEKLKRLTGLNLFRFVNEEACSTAWDLIMDEFCKLMRVKESTLRLNSIETFSLVVDLFIKSVPPARMKASICEKSDESPCESLQMRLLAPMAKFTRSSAFWIDVQRGLLDSLMKYLNIYGECLNEASWSLIWSMLKDDLESIKSREVSQLQQQSEKESSDALSIASLYQKVHDVVKITSNDFLPSIPIACLDDFIKIISHLGRINLPGELNIPLNTVRYLWDISDFLCGKGGSNDVFLLWKGLLIQLTELSLDPRPELRNSAVQTLLRTINMNGGALKGYPEHWNCIFEDIIFVFLQRLRESAATSRHQQGQLEQISNSETNTVIPLGFAHFSRDTEAKQWDETESTVMQGVTTLINTHFKGVLASELPHFPQLWQRFLFTLKDYALLKDGSVELTSVAITSLSQLALSLKSESSGSTLSVEIYAQSLWETWESIGMEGFFKVASPSTSVCLFFTQDSLLKYLKTFVAVFDLCPRSLNWLKRSLKCLTGCIQCLTPSDQVRDVEVITEVQKFLLSQVVMDVLVPKASGFEKVEVLSVISEWLELTTNAPSGMSQNMNGIEMISMGYASLRSRQSTGSTASIINDGSNSPVNEGGLIKYTFIAMTSVLLEKIPGIVLNWISCSEEVFGGGADECLSSLMKSLGRFMALKYKCPMNSKMEPIWRTSTSVFTQILKVMFSEPTVKFSDGLWVVIVTELKLTLHSCKEMFNRSVKLDALEADEKFDCQLVEMICDSLIPRALSDKSDKVVEEAVKILFQVARITKFPGEGSAFDDFSFPSGIKALPVAVKEIIAFHAYKSIFILAKKHQQNPFVWSLILNKLQGLLRKHLDAFESDRKIFGNDFSFPRLRDLELHCLLTGMIKLGAREELKPVYDLIVRCADFGAGGCEGARLIVKDCRRVLLLLSSTEIEDNSDPLDFEEVYEHLSTDVDEVKEPENQIQNNSPLVILKASRESIKSSKSTTKTANPISSSSTNNSPSIPSDGSSTAKPSPTLLSSRRSVSEELFDHLAHDLRIMALSQDSSNQNQKDSIFL